MFELLKNEVKKHYMKKIEKLRNEKIDDIIDFYGTNNVKEKYKNGTITVDRAYQLSINRGIKELEKYKNSKLNLLDLCENSEDVDSININVEWVKNKTWGYNPKVSVTVITENDIYTYTGRASGCGYDKKSSAVAEALNSSPEVKKILYTLAEKMIDENGEDAYYYTGCGDCVSWRNSIGYGSGYSILPYFEGGVGVNCFFDIFEKIGFKCKQVGSGKSFDVYNIIRVRE